MHAEVETMHGRLRGSVKDGFTAFKGVAYGADTSGAGRFMPPRPPEPWIGVRDALTCTAQAPQSRVGFGRRPELADFASPPDTTPESEDCLTLNLWTPQLGTSGAGDGARRPVMVWLHGGAFSFGSANGARVDGGHLAGRQSVVVVTVNQRLNIFGHLDLSTFSGAEFAPSGNAGTLDMIAALEWVRDNISNFGGDPGNVTIFGESGGAGKVSTLMAMPRAKGLFHRAIAQSGAVIRLREPGRAAALTEAILFELGLGRTQIGELQSIPVARLIAAIEPAVKALGPSPWPLFDRYPFGPVVDGTIVPRHPFEPDAPECSADIPLLVGDTKDEASLFLAQNDAVWNGTLTEAELSQQVAVVAGANTDRVLAHYRRLLPGKSPADRLIATLTDCNFRIRSWTMAERRVATAPAPTYFYTFAWESPAFGGRLKSPHAMDVPFTFDTVDLLPPNHSNGDAATLATAMSGTWAAFARTGVPRHPSIPEWPAYTPDQRATLVFDRRCRIDDDPGAETRVLWQEIASKQG